MSVYSHSKLQTYENCPLAYRLRYIERIKVRKEGVEAFLGSRIHDALEALYRDVGMGKFMSLPIILSIYETAWDTAWHDNISIVRKEYQAQDYRCLGAKYISDYYQRYQPFNQSKTVELEHFCQIALGGGKVSFRGYIDRLDFTGENECEIHDYKSSKRLPTQQYLDKDRQLALYQIGVEQMWPQITKVHLVWHYLAFDRELRSYRTGDELKSLEDELIETVAQIESATKAGKFEPKVSRLCDWCDLHEYCPDH